MTARKSLNLLHLHADTLEKPQVIIMEDKARHQLHLPVHHEVHLPVNPAPSLNHSPSLSDLLFHEGVQLLLDVQGQGVIFPVGAWVFPTGNS